MFESFKFCCSSCCHADVIVIIVLLLFVTLMLFTLSNLECCHNTRGHTIRIAVKFLSYCWKFDRLIESN